jgi:hypothetical protein
MSLRQVGDDQGVDEIPILTTSGILSSSPARAAKTEREECNDYYGRGRRQRRASTLRSNSYGFNR